APFAHGGGAGLDAREVGDVHAEGHRLAGALLEDERRRLLGAGEVDIGDGHAAAVAREALADGAPDPAPAARDDRHLALESHGPPPARSLRGAPWHDGQVADIAGWRRSH